MFCYICSNINPTPNCMKVVTKVLPVVFLLVGLIAKAQPISSEWKNEGEGRQKLTITNNLFVPIILKVNFSDPSTFDASVPTPYTTGVPARGSTSITMQEKSYGSPNYSWTYSYWWGCNNAKPDLEYPYLMPIGNKKEVKIRGLYLFSATSKTPVRNYYAISFSANKGDTVFAARRGTVFNLRSNADLKHDKYSMTTEDNHIYIIHKDCSYAWYKVLDEVLVKEGQKVEAGEPIAIVGGSKYEQGNHVRFSVMYPYFCDSCNHNAGDYGLEYVKLKFYLSEGKVDTLTHNKAYTSTLSDEIITKEMSKSELKKWRKSHPLPAR